MTCGIYAIVNTKNNKRYIGSSRNIELRWNQHHCDLRKNRHHSIALQRAWNKYGEGSFQFKILIKCSVDELLDYEQKYLDKQSDYNITNIAGRPVLGKSLSKSTKAKLSKAHIGNKNALGHRLSDAARLKISKGNSGKKRSKKFIVDLAKRMKGNKYTLGYKHSNETIKKISDASKNMWLVRKNNNVD